MKSVKRILNINQGDVLTFKASDNKYRMILCTSTYKERSPFNFTFAALTYQGIQIPNIEDVMESEFYGTGNTKNDYFKYSESELDKMWKIHPETKPYFLGSYGLIIWRKDFLKMRDEFQLICSLKILDNLDKNGNGAMNSSAMYVLDKLFVEQLETLEKLRGQRKMKIKAILK